MFHKIVDAISGNNEENKKKIKGRVVLMKKHVLDLNDINALVVDDVHELLGQRVSLQLISAVNLDHSGLRGKIGSPAYLENWITTFSLAAGETGYDVTFEWEEDVGVPGAFIIKNFHHSQFLLKTLTLDDVPGCGKVHFVCNSWVYPADKYNYDRIFFTNQTYLPSDTPLPLVPYRREELMNLRGNGRGRREEWDRIYDYDYYNDLGEPDIDPEHARPVLGGSTEYPYPRRIRTGRPPTKTDPKSESRLPLLTSVNVYVPRDERFGHLRVSDFVIYALKAVIQFLVPELEALFDSSPADFDTFEDVLKLYSDGIKILQGPLVEKIREKIPFEALKELIRVDGDEGLIKLPTPHVISDNKSAWKTDEEFARQTLAGVNPVSIRLLQEFPPTSRLNPEIYGNQTSTITINHIENSLDGLTVYEAMKTNKLFILDHHDTIMPYLRRINATVAKAYATRTLLFLQKDGTLKLLAIELSLPHPQGDQFGAVSKVYTPAKEGTVEGSVWLLAKAFVGVCESGAHQLFSHWLTTHASIEPFVIATNRQLSVMHPIYKLLQPHLKGTMNINGLSRQILNNAGGVIEKSIFLGPYAMEMSSNFYKNYWVYTDQALPVDLIKRGMAVEDTNAPYGIRLLIEDYPYAVDGLKIWSAIKTWVDEYINIYYKTDETVQNDDELQLWWKEVREVAHGDKKNEPWWPKMQTRNDLINSCTILMWTTSGRHAAVNFGQYPYGGFHLNRPSMSRRFMPETGTPEYELLKVDPEKVFLNTMSSQLQTLLGIVVIERLSMHTSDEVYLGDRDMPEWTTENEALEAFERFGKKIKEIGEFVTKMNNDEKLKNRNGPAKMPYTFLYPTSESGLTAKGVPNSVSI